MWAYFARRVLIAIPTIWLVATLIFFGVRVLPGDPAIAALGAQASQQAVTALREQWGLNEPMLSQYGAFWANFFRGDWGHSYQTSLPVAEIIARGLPYTLLLTTFNLLLGAVIGIPLGIFAALHAGSIWDKLGQVVSLFGLSAPTFYIGLLFLYFFGFRLQLFPIIGGGNWSHPGDILAHLILPGTAGGLFLAAYFARLARAGFLEVLGEEYVRTARSKGLSERVVLYKHVLRNVSVSLLTFLGIYAVVMLTANVLLELVFTRPGLGSIVIKSIMGRDYLLLQNVMVIYAGFVIVINLVVDFLNALLDPTVRYG
jgi:peptide/nickel transport system permease protein